MNTFVFSLTVWAKTISNVNNVYIIQISFKLSECWIEIFISYKILIRRMIPINWNLYPYLFLIIIR